MKRTGEIVLGIIGVIIYAFFTMIGALMVWIKNNEDKIRGLMEEVSKEDPENALTPEEINETLAAMGNSGWFVFSAALAVVIIGIVSVVFLKGNKRPKPAGVLLIVSGVLSVFILGELAIIGAIPYIIAGIMCLMRKQPEPIDDLE
ncbi:MAG TPA: DUF4064 domain-containing protein [Virgibacillus sp.]|nr:DUF4064 domain-containing protein [Virgibacillus sp.]